VDIRNDFAFTTASLTARNSISYPDIEIPRNRVSFIVGESGSGKTTLLRLFNQTETQTSGTIHFFGNDVSIMDATTLRINAVLCGQKVFLFNGTIRENFNEFRRYVAIDPKAGNPLSDEMMKKFLSICYAEQDLDKECGNLSGGEKARVFIAIHLAFVPAVLMLDEPTSALDNETAINMMKSIGSYCSENEITLIVVSHDRSVIDAVADNIIDLGGKKNG
jgi:putative ABC transport system ATP-binding protein